MTAPVFIGDEVTAAGYRLAGVRVLVPGEGAEADVFASALNGTELLLITAMSAARIPERQLRDALSRAEPLIAIVPDAANRVAVPDIAGEVDRALGIASS